VGSGTGSYFNSTDANLTGPVQDATIGTVNGDASFSLSLSGDTALQSFLTSAGSNVQWGIYGGAFTGSIASQQETRGNTLIVTTGTDTTILPVSAGSTHAFDTDLGTDIKGLNGGTFDSFNGVTNAFPASSGTANQNFNLYGAGVKQGTTLSGTQNLYGITGNGTGSGQELAYLLGTATFDGNTLSFTGESAAVPIPAAAWLFGSGLLGLLGISRRRRDAAAA
jgi:hypothetical protein